jgi:hypothetical protein
MVPRSGMVLFAHGVRSIGLADRALARPLARARQDGSFVGVDEQPTRPLFAVLARYDPALRRLDGRWPVPPPLSWGEVEDLLGQSDAARRSGVSIRTGGSA